VQEQLVDPVLASDGWTYSRKAIELWFHHGFEISPVTKDFFPSKTTVPNILIQEVLDASLNPHMWGATV
jgi:hypothetical protein